MHDIVVVGAGPAGVSFAKFAAKKGFDVAVLDLLDFSRLWSKPCGDAVDKEIFEKVDIASPSGDEVKQKVKGLDIYAPDYSFSVRLDGPGYMINRTAMGQRVMRKAVNYGAEFFERTAFKKVILENGKVCGVVAKKDGKVLEFRSNLVVECTGDAAVVKSQLPREWPVAERTRYKMLCLRGKVMVKEVENPEYLRIYTNRKLAPKSYWWFFPEGPNHANVGLGVLPEDRGVLMMNYKKILSKFPVSKVLEESGAYVPAQRPARSLVGPGVLVLGDAAPTVNPMSGGGLSSTFLAAQVAASKLDKVAEGGWSYEAAWAMNECMRKGGDMLGAFDVVKTAFWNADEELIKKGIKALESGSGFMGMLADPHLRKVSLLAVKVRNHYRRYPEKPEGLDRWSAKLDSLFNSLNF
jgi:geranylgeranyl reductase family protein